MYRWTRVTQMETVVNHSSWIIFTGNHLVGWRPWCTWRRIPLRSMISARLFFERYFPLVPRGRRRKRKHLRYCCACLSLGGPLKNRVLNGRMLPEATITRPVCSESWWHDASPVFTNSTVASAAHVQRTLLNSHREQSATLDGFLRDSHARWIVWHVK